MKGSCWVWFGEMTGSGYGRIRAKGSGKSAHRVIYEFLVGIVPEGKELDHLCRNRACVNPKHLEPVTHAENVRRGWVVRLANTPNCKNGHPFTGKNLYIATDRKNNKSWRACRACRREAALKIRLKRGVTPRGPLIKSVL